MMYKDEVDDFLGVNINQKDDGTIHLMQPHRIQSILEDLHLDGDNINHKATPAPVTVPLCIFEAEAEAEAPPFDHHFHYCSIIIPGAEYLTGLLLRHPPMWLVLCGTQGTACKSSLACGVVSCHHKR